MFRMATRSNRFQKKKKKPNNGLFRPALILLVLAAVTLSISTLVLSWFAIQKDNSLKEQLVSTVDTPHLGGQPKEPQLRKPSGVTNNDGESNKYQNAETAISERRTTKAEEETPKLNVLPLPVPAGNSISSGTGNSAIYQPPQTGKRLFTYKRFGGRLNNQIFQFITALQHAKVLKRKFVVPNEVRDVDWTGMFDGFDIWDLESLNAVYNIDWDLGLSVDFVTTIPENCVLSPKEGRDLLNGGPKLWEEWDRKCPDVIDIAGNTGLLFCEQQHQFCGDEEAQMEAYKIYEHVKLSASLLQHLAPRREEFKDKGYNELAIHSRRAGEGGYNWELCVGGNSRTCRGHVTGSDQSKFCDVRTMTGNCAAWLDLDYQIKSISALKKDQKDYRFVLASDGTHDWNIDFKGQFIVANNTDWLNALEKKVLGDADPEKLIDTMAVSALAHSKLRKQKDLARFRGKLDQLTATLLDLFSLVDSKYLLGAYYSTLSLNACYFRGMDRIYDSNMCWMLMHPNSKHAILPPLHDSVNVNKNPTEDDPMPAALMSDVEHAFVRSEDDNFIAIDRYLVQYKGKQVIGVLGDGLVPLTIVKNDKGEEIVRADFTCSYGNQHNSPATIILMKGNESFNEHYYVRGEKYNTPFSTNGDRFRTMIILCEQLNYDRALARHPPLILASSDGKFSITIGSTFQRPVGQVMTAKSTVKQEALVHCLNPVYGLKDPRWIIEYLEYHRAIGVAHVHIYNIDLHGREVQDALQAFRDEDFITRHDWSGKASRGYTTKKTYEHAKWAAQTDCALRSRGIFDYALFSDIDEVAVGGSNGHLGPAVEMCKKAKEQKQKIACSFNSNTVSSIFTKLDESEEMAMRDKLILERYDGVEAKPYCPANCKCMGNNCSTMTRKFHTGRQKYMVNVRDLNIAPRVMWTHALARDYDEMDKIMEVLPDEVMHVRHYQGHWYKNNNLLSTMEEKDAPLPKELMEVVRSSIGTSKDKRRQFTKRLVYDKAKAAATSYGVEWIQTVERPSQYHKKRTL